ncbi:MAG: rubrerythrin family protein [Deltaproteobacteria bacterium]|nr:rubrerythrin family protein [Deltaproteobacteria bacterium]
MFERANEVEKIHFGLYEQAAASLEAGGDLAEEEIYVCSVCGNTVSGSCPDKCSVCGVPGSKFDKIS